MSLPKYRSHKIVEAFKISDISFNEDGTASLSLPTSGEFLTVSAAYCKKHEPLSGGYYVRYDDGYESWSPATAFEAGYTLLTVARSYRRVRARRGARADRQHAQQSAQARDRDAPREKRASEIMASVYGGGDWTSNATTTGAIGQTITLVFSNMPPPPACNKCGSHVIAAQTQPDKLLWCAGCFEIFRKEFSRHHAPEWIEAAFYALDKPARKKLYRALSAVFHPDAGGDHALMVVLNQVNDRLG